MSTSYRVLLPAPWEQVPLDERMPGRVREIVDASVARLPASVPPDQVAPTRHRIERELTTQLTAARDNGGVDFFLPTDLMHGVQLNATFVVALITPDASAEPELVPRVMASLLAREGAKPVSIDDTVWVRTESVQSRSADDVVGEDVAVRRVQYRTALPDDPRRWVVVTYTGVGDGDPHSDASAIVVDLFDAIMTTWRWQQA